MISMLKTCLSYLSRPQHTTGDKGKTALAHRNDAGYSLLEILVVMAIIGTLMSLVAPRLLGNVDKSKVIAAKAQARSLRLALDSYKLDTGRYPNLQEGLQALITAPQNETNGWFGPYMDVTELPKDPWGHPYQYEPPETTPSGRATSPKVTSLGADNLPGGTGFDADVTA